MRKKYVEVPLSGDGSVSDLINDFINHLQKASGGNINVLYDDKGQVVIYYEMCPPNSNKLDSGKTIQYRGYLKSLPMSESKTNGLRED